MSKVALITDTHFGIKGDSPIFYEYFDKFLENSFFPELKRRKIDKIIHLGDVFDRRKTVNFATLTWARKNFFDKIKGFATMDIIVGNHDTYYKNTNNVNSPILLLGDYDNIRIFEEVYEEDNLIYVPWITDENSEKTLRTISASSAKILLGHLSIIGFAMHKGVLCDDGLTSEIFRQFHLVLSGHFHTKSESSNIYYLGSAWDLISTDVDDIKGFHILDTETGSLEFIQNPYKLFNRTYYDDSSATSVNDILLGDAKYKSLENTFVKVIIKSKVNPVFFDRFSERMTESNPYSVVYAEQYLEIQNSEEISTLSEDTIDLIKSSVKDYSDLLSDKDKELELENVLSELYIEAIKL